MKILMVIPQLSMGGAERSFANVARFLNKDYEVHCAVFNDQDVVDYDTTTPIHSLQVEGGGTILNKLRAFYFRYRKLRRLADKLNADVVISYLDGANFLNAMLPRKYRRILSQRGSIYHDITASARRLNLMKRLYPRADAIVALNEDIREEFKSLLPEYNKVVVIPNFFDMQEIEEKAALNVNLADRFNFCLVGRLAPEKGFHHLLGVAGMLKRRGGLNAAFYIVGDGPYETTLKSIADKEGLTWSESEEDTDSDVYFLGRKSNPYPYIRKSDALLIGSSAEGGPNVLLEAMICKTLVISANCPGAPRYRLVPDRVIPTGFLEPVYGENGLLLPNFQQGDVVLDVWVEALEKIAEKEEQRSQMVLNAYKFIQDFTVSHVIDKWKEVARP